MSVEKNKYQDQSLFNLTWPLFIEISLHMSVGIIATLILSGYSDNAVAGVGVANQIMNIFILVFNVTAIGATILIGQNLGANQIKEARTIARSAFGLNFWIGIGMTIIVAIFGGIFLNFYGLSGEVYGYAHTYLVVTGLSLCLEAVALALSAVLRSYGHTRETMFVTIVMNVISIIGFLIAINGLFGIPVTGVVGVSISIIVARLFLVFALLFFVYKRLAIRYRINDILKIDKTNTKNLMGIGIPSAGEQLSYQLSQVVITSFVAIVGDAALAARVYILNISMFCFMFTMAISQGTQILVARYIGAKQYKRTLKRGLKTLRIAFFVSVVISFIIAFTGESLLGLFTEDPMIIAVALPVLWAIVFIEPGRAVNMVLMGSLKSVGDVRFPVIIGIISMWGLAVVLSYVFGISLGLGLLGVWLAQGVDEWVRGIFAFRRWKSQPWLRKKVRKDPA
ncbi:MATE family efflux transporter [Oceanobacillus profundus]|uniref:MATE family efflux transporter n=1 Tax=Oceanobacillus profundus TaxID=372463 RepID=A0A417YAU8_9BACI|nr:MATE family efflux transporter [Oceanobacillus profundus]MBR3119646.1 MATE family efflux transporter [Oceanobacillus sp.]MDO6451380.1 MATE family efflux transporter [Oceanobacillus profundus]PAE30744.1 MATE family efflux transporter [Paenibacillus sp. 7884-2]RHW29828.1 MATE family efflux transporter [Oceanobacillus profundus]